MRGICSRRGFLLGAGGVVASAAAAATPRQPQEAPLIDTVGARLLPWRPGRLDIHHIATGRGDSALVIGPTGGSLLIDAGASASPPNMSLPVMPGPERRAGEWIARYVTRQVAAAAGIAIDAALITHIHPDHLGDVSDALPWSADGTYRLAGISDVDALCPVRRIIDRGFPSYDWPQASTAPFASNYRAFVDSRMKAGRMVERVRVGTSDQLMQPFGRTPFEVRTIAGNGEVWVGEGERSHAHVPPLSSLPREHWPDENVLSVAVRIRFGDFAYYAAGDLTCTSHDGTLPWRDIGTAAANACGLVDVAVAPHHGMWDGISGDMVRALSPRAWIIQPWHVSHPNLSALERMVSPHLYAGPREILTTGLTPAGELVNQRIVDRFAVRRGHVIVRVGEEGRSFTLVATGNADELDRVTHVLGPFPARGAGTALQGAVR